jgi:hypothetical protein
MKLLRKAMGPYANFITTLRGLGYIGLRGEHPEIE